MSKVPSKQTALQIVKQRLIDAYRAVALKNAVYDLDGFEMTDQEAIEVLAKIDAVDPFRQGTTP